MQRRKESDSMGGWGSGNTDYRFARCTTDKCKRRLDSFSFTAHITEKAQIDISWGDGSNIGAIFFTDKLRIGYTAGIEKVCTDIHFSSVANNFGGSRLYFICPSCNRRSRFLHMHQKHFKCRLCAGYGYKSQQFTKSSADVISHRLNAFIKANFNDNDNLSSKTAYTSITPSRPKGMHRATYNRLLTRLQALQADYWACKNKQYQRMVTTAFRVWKL